MSKQNRGQRVGRLTYAMNNYDIIRAESMEEEEMIQVINIIENNDVLKKFLNLAISKPKVSFKHVNPTMITKIELETGIIIEPSNDDVLTIGERKKKTIIEFFSNRK